MSKAKAVTATIRLVIPAGQAKPSPPVGPALGQAGLKIMDFCKDFNAKTADYKVSAMKLCAACKRERNKCACMAAACCSHMRCWLSAVGSLLRRFHRCNQGLASMPRVRGRLRKLLPGKRVHGCVPPWQPGHHQTAACLSPCLRPCSLTCPCRWRSPPLQTRPSSEH